MAVPVVCLQCGRNTKTDFYKSHSECHQTTGLLPICRICLKKQYKKYYSHYKNNNFCLFLMCRKYDYAYYKNIAKGVVRSYEEKGNKETPFSAYLGTLPALGKTQKKAITCFDDGDTEYDKKINIKDFEITEEMEMKWHPNLTPTEFQFLEKKYEEYAKNIIVDEAIHSLIIQTCYTELDLRRYRSAKEIPDTKRTKELTDVLQGLIKNLGMDAKSKVEKDNGKLVNSLGMAVKEYEEIEPVDFLGKLNTLKDVNNIEGYLLDYHYRPTKNNVMNNNDFTLKNTSEDENFEYLDGKL